MHKKDITAFHRRLHSWYESAGRRDLPWRTTRDPYAIYLSEIMLQQTQVKTVLERFYFQFLKKFPTLKRLASAPQDDVLHAWQGLGYYNRARNLHAAAKECKGALPQSVDALMSLPGIGRNTAHAVAAFAYRQPVAVMEANLRRVLSRMFALPSASEDMLWEKATLLLDTKNPFDYNQAMMDIGAMICTKTAPRCADCPANTICQGQTSPASYPAAKAKKAVPVRRKHISVLRNKRGEYHATPRTDKFLGGLYHFTESDTPPAVATLLGGVRQQYSHFRLEAHVWLVESKGSGKDWYSATELHTLPMSMAEKKILVILSEAEGS